MGGVSNGTIFRVPRQENYTVMSNMHLRDPNLTWKARGLMSTILSFPPDWDYTLAGLATCAKDNIASTRTGVLELENNGYLHRLQHRKLTEHGRRWSFRSLKIQHRTLISKLKQILKMMQK